jgi:hypothetical protein
VNDEQMQSEASVSNKLCAPIKERAKTLQPVVEATLDAPSISFSLCSSNEDRHHSQVCLDQATDTALQPPLRNEGDDSSSDLSAEYKSVENKGRSEGFVTTTVRTAAGLVVEDASLPTKKRTGRCCQLFKLAKVVSVPGSCEINPAAVNISERESVLVKSMRGGARRLEINVENVVSEQTNALIVASHIKGLKNKMKRAQPQLATVEMPATRVSLRAVKNSSKKEQQLSAGGDEDMEWQAFCQPIRKRKISKRGATAVNDNSTCPSTGMCANGKSPHEYNATKKTSKVPLIKIERKVGDKRANSNALASTQLYGSIVLSLQDTEHISSTLGRNLLSRIRPAFRMVVLSVVSMGMYYCRSTRRAPLHKKWVHNGHDDIGMFDKIRTSAARWAVMLGLVEQQPSAEAATLNNVASLSLLPHIPVLDLLMQFIKACWEDHGKEGVVTASTRRADCKHEYL